MDWKRIPSLAALRAFEAAARRQSYTRAAEELNVTQAAIAQHVRTLENDLSEVLTKRKGRGIELTAKGRQLAEYLADGFALIADGIETVRAQSDARPLRLSTSPGFAAHWLMPRMGDFWTRHPDIDVSITPSVDVVDLRRDGFDVAIRYGEGPWPGVTADLLTDGDFWVVAHPDVVRDLHPKCLPDVAHLTWFVEAQMRELRALAAGEGVDVDQITVKRMATNTLALAAVKSGIGVSVQSKSLVEDDVAKGDLAKICELAHDNVGYYLVTIPGREVYGLRPFVTWLKRQVRAGQEA